MDSSRTSAQPLPTQPHPTQTSPTVYWIILHEKKDSDGHYVVDSLRVYDCRYEVPAVLFTIADDTCRADSNVDLNDISEGERKKKFVKTGFSTDNPIDGSYFLLEKKVCWACRKVSDEDGPDLRKCICQHEEVYELEPFFSTTKREDKWLGGRVFGRREFYYPVSVAFKK